MSNIQGKKIEGEHRRPQAGDPSSIPMESTPEQGDLPRLRSLERLVRRLLTKQGQLPLDLTDALEVAQGRFIGCLFGNREEPSVSEPSQRRVTESQLWINHI